MNEVEIIETYELTSIVTARVLDEWVYVPELVSAAQAEALTKLLETAYDDALGFDYKSDDV